MRPIGSGLRPDTQEIPLSSIEADTHLPAFAAVDLRAVWARIPREKVNFERGARNCCSKR